MSSLLIWFTLPFFPTENIFLLFVGSWLPLPTTVLLETQQSVENFFSKKYKTREAHKLLKSVYYLGIFFSGIMF
jgi:hypothetical protein